MKLSIILAAISAVVEVAKIIRDIWTSGGRRKIRQRRALRKSEV